MIEEAPRGCEETCGRICIVVGACGSPLEKVAGKLSADCHVHAVGHCAYLFLNRAIVDAYIRDGACLLLPGWLQRWRHYLEQPGDQPGGQPGLDGEAAGRRLAGAFRRLVLVDTGVDARSPVYLEELAGHTGLPFEAVPAGLDLFRLVLKDLVNRWRLESEAKYRTIFEAARTATVVVGEDAAIRLANDQFALISGYAKEEIEGQKNLIDFVAPKGLEKGKRLPFLRRPEAGAAARQQEPKQPESKQHEQRQREPRQHEIEFLSRDGSSREFLITVDGIPGTAESVVSFLDITRRKVTEERLKYLSFHDVLTGLYNRSYFEEELKRLDVKRQLPLSIIMGDVNGLKLVNDTLGHQTGDKLIRGAGKILKKICRKEEIICRWGGDEFAILLPRENRDAAEKICDRIRKACEEGGEESAPLSFALGTASKESADQAIESVLKEAEDNMYRDKLLDSRSSRFSMIVFFQKALAEKSAETPEHGRRIKDLALKIGDGLGLSNREREELDILAALHDIGQIAIPGDILSKPCYLDSEEWELMKKHPEIGERIVRTVPNLIDIAEAILCHHECWDGTGYPRKLRGKQIPLLSRILAIADAYDVMTGGRPYKKAMSHGEAIEEIRKCAGTQFDPELAGRFIDLVSRGG